MGRGREWRVKDSVQFEKQEKQPWEPCILIHKIVVKFMTFSLILPVITLHVLVGIILNLSGTHTVVLGGFGICPMPSPIRIIVCFNTHKMSIARGWRPHCWLPVMPALT